VGKVQVHITTRRRRGGVDREDQRGARLRGNIAPLGKPPRLAAFVHQLKAPGVNDILRKLLPPLDALVCGVLVVVPLWRQSPDVRAGTKPSKT